jgi:glutamate/tyrosine decarboxylase-like PLP-dependent enzyme
MALSPLHTVKDVLNKSLSGREPFQIVVGTVGGVVLVYAATHVVCNASEYLEGAKKTFFSVLRKVPVVESTIEKEKAKALKHIRDSFETPGQKFDRIPEKGKEYSEVLALMHESHQYDFSKYGTHNLSGTIYLGDDEHTKFTNEAYGMFSLSNPLHTDSFPNVRRYEAEVIGMTARMMHGGPNVCGAMTSGGTESILMAMKAYRDYARAKKGITKPELVAPITAHAAFDKACYYFGIKLVHVGLDAEYKVDLRAVKNAINKNTIAIVGSACNFPHGMIDDIESLAVIAKQHNVGLHVDSCLGGFVLPWIARLDKYHKDIPLFDFRVDGVTSMSADTHKYGYAPKGTSVVLYHNHELRTYMFFAAPNWTGGIYGSPTMAGSRPGGLIAAAWGTLVAIGEDGYLEKAEGIMEASREMLEGTKKITDLIVIGEPKAMVIAFASRNSKVNIFQVSAAMGKRGWHLNSLQKPDALHICVTAKHIGTGPKFVTDLTASVEEVKAFPDLYKNSSAAMYGSAASIPDRSLVNDVIVGVLDLMLTEV